MMKKVHILLLSILFIVSTGFGIHKFYMGIFQINYAPEKSMLQITSRIFVDDLNKALEKKYKAKEFHIGSVKETEEEKVLLNKYIADHFTIKVNGKMKPMQMVRTEMEGDVLVCYSRIDDVHKIMSLQIFNSILMDFSSEQQNITHITLFGEKKSVLFTDSSRTTLLKY